MEYTEIEDCGQYSILHRGDEKEKMMCLYNTIYDSNQQSLGYYYTDYRKRIYDVYDNDENLIMQVVMNGNKDQSKLGEGKVVTAKIVKNDTTMQIYTSEPNIKNKPGIFIDSVKNTIFERDGKVIFRLSRLCDINLKKTNRYNLDYDSRFGSFYAFCLAMICIDAKAKYSYSLDTEIDALI